MKKQFYLIAMVVLCLSAKPSVTDAQSVGVFYMPFWRYGYPGSPLSSGGHWPLIDNYNSIVSTSAVAPWVPTRPDLALKPMDLYSPSDAWYDESQQFVVEKQQELMSKAGIDFVIYENSFARYANSGFPYYGAYWDHAVQNVIKPGFNNSGMKFAIMWADQFMNLVKDPDNGANYCNEFFDAGGGLDQIIDLWIPYITHANYKQIDGKPVIYIFYPSTLGDLSEPNANSIEGMTGKCKTHSVFSSLGGDIYEPYINHKKTNLLLQLIKSKIAAKTSNAITDIYFTAVLVPPVSNNSDPSTNSSEDWAYKWNWLVLHPGLAGYNALTTYGFTYFEHDDAFAWTNQCKYRVTPTYSGYGSGNNWNYDFSKMRQVYQRFHDYILDYATVDYQVPVTAGFNRGALNITKPVKDYEDACNWWAESPRDQAKSSPYTFQLMLQEAKAKANFSAAHISKSRSTYIISAWNEYAEGNVIEPTEYYGYSYLNAVRAEFKPWLPVISSKPETGTLNPTAERANTGVGFDFSIIPNPAKDVLNIMINKTMYERLSFYLYDFNTHSLVKSWENQTKQAGYGFDIKGLKSGQYILEMKGGKQKKSRQVILSN